MDWIAERRSCLFTVGLSVGCWDGLKIGIGKEFRCAEDVRRMVASFSHRTTPLPFLNLSPTSSGENEIAVSNVAESANIRGNQTADKALGGHG